MSSGGYDAPHIPQNFSRYESRRMSGGIPAAYDRPPNLPIHRRSPSPTSSRRSYDNYVIHRSDISDRPGPSNVYVYRTKNYRPEYSSSYYSRSPSPDPYKHPVRASEPDVWDRGPWVPPSSNEAPNVWPERKINPPSPARGRPLRHDSSRTFEPSDSWKQTHVDRGPWPERSPPFDRYPDRRMRISERSPARPLKNDKTAVALIPGGDRYKFPVAGPKRDTYTSARSDYDSPGHTYDNNWASSSRRDPISPTNGHHRRDSGSVTYSRSSDNYESPYSSQGLSRKPSISPHLVSPLNTPGWTPSDAEKKHWSHRPITKEGLLHRTVSRSSIASTQVSDTKSPDLFTPVASGNNDQRLVAEPSASLEQQTSTDRVGTSVEVQTTEQSKFTKSPRTGTSSSRIAVPLETAENLSRSSVQETSSILNSLVSSIEASTINPQVKKGSDPLEKSVTSPRDCSAEPPTSNIRDVNGQKNSSDIKQPKPVYPPSPLFSEMRSPPELDIPPPIHSPTLLTPPPLDNGSSPFEVQLVLPIPEEIPAISEAKTIKEALRIVVMTRLLCDHQTREERVNPVLAANLSISNPPEAHPIATPDILIAKMTQGKAFQELAKSFRKTRPMLLQYISQRREKTEDKIARLKEEYLTLHERWIAHCHNLNEQQKSLASEHENQHSGRTTRRSTAITDAVRSDFEMEQIIASLGVDDATDPNHLSMRNVARIPDMISVTRGKVDVLFDDSSGLVINPSEYYAREGSIQEWTEEEKRIFLDKFAAYPKQFGIIADYLPHKTAAQCVDYYYLHKKQFIDFRRVVSQFAPNKRRRRGMGKKKGNALLVDIAKHDMEVSRGAAESTARSFATRAPRGRKTVAPPDSKKPPSVARRSGVQFEDTPVGTPTPDPEPEVRTRRRRGNNNSTSASTSATNAATPLPTPVPTSAPPSVPPTPPMSSTSSASRSKGIAPSSAASVPTPIIASFASVHPPPPPKAPLQMATTLTAPPTHWPHTVPTHTWSPPIPAGATSVWPVPTAAGSSWNASLPSGYSPGYFPSMPIPTFSPTVPPPVRFGVPEEDPPELSTGGRPMKRQRRTRRIKSAATVSDDADPLTPPPDQPKELPSVSHMSSATSTTTTLKLDDSREAEARAQREREKALANSNPTSWTEEDKKHFLDLLGKHGNDFKKIAVLMQSKTETQLSNYYKANEVAYDLGKLASSAPRRSPSPPKVNESKEDRVKLSTKSSSATASNSSTGTTSIPLPPMASLSAEPSRTSSHIRVSSYTSVPSRDHGRPPMERVSQATMPTYQRYSYPSQPPMAALTTAGGPSDMGRVYSPPVRPGSYAYGDSAADSRPMFFVHSSPKMGSANIDGPPGRPASTSAYSTSGRPYPGGYTPVTVAGPPLSSSSGASSGSGSEGQNSAGPTLSNNSRSNAVTSGKKSATYVPPPAVGPNAPSIVHSPTGMSPPKPPHMQLMQAYPATQSDPANSMHTHHPYPHPHHRPYYSLPPGGDPRMGVSAGHLPGHPAQQHSSQQPSQHPSQHGHWGAPPPGYHYGSTSVGPGPAHAGGPAGHTPHPSGVYIDDKEAGSRAYAHAAPGHGHGHHLPPPGSGGHHPQTETRPYYYAGWTTHAHAAAAHQHQHPHPSG